MNTKARGWVLLGGAILAIILLKPSCSFNFTSVPLDFPPGMQVPPK